MGEQEGEGWRGKTGVGVASDGEQGGLRVCVRVWGGQVCK